MRGSRRPLQCIPAGPHCCGSEGMKGGGPWDRESSCRECMSHPIRYELEQASTFSMAGGSLAGLIGQDGGIIV